MKLLFLVPVLVLVAAISGCSTTSNDARAANATYACQQKCVQLSSSLMDFTNGPCLDDAIAPDWVCDMAHYPREAVDNDPANQCPSYGKTAHHFVEVTEHCRLIRAV
jgi:hypothetical protein